VPGIPPPPVTVVGAGVEDCSGVSPAAVDVGTNEPSGAAGAITVAEVTEIGPCSDSNCRSADQFGNLGVGVGRSATRLLGVDDAAELEQEGVRVLLRLHVRELCLSCLGSLLAFSASTVACAFTLSMKPMACLR